MSVLERAFAAIHAGNPLEAETLATSAAKNAARRFGDTSGELAVAEFELAQVLLAVGDFARSAEAMRRAAAIPPKDRAGERHRLTCLMNLGEVLQRMGRIDQAREVLEDGLEGRARFYGVDTEGYAFGQEPLADVLLAQGELERASALAESAFATLWKAGNPRALPTAALRAAVRFARHGDEVPLLDCYDALPPEGKAELVQACLRRVEVDAPARSLGVLTELRERLEDDDAPPSDALPQVMAALSNVARGAGNSAVRVEALTWLLARFEAQGDERQVVSACLGLALAHDDAGQVDEAAARYAQASGRAQALGDVGLMAQVKRNEALFLSAHERPQAEAAFDEAVSLAERSGDAELRGRALIARGIFVQHRGQLDDARGLLERALALLPPSHPDTLYARSHLDAIVHARSCGCGDMSGAVGQALEAMVRSSLPDGLLDSISVQDVDDLTVSVSLARQPSADEQELLNRVLHQAISELRGRIRRSGYVS